MHTSQHRCCLVVNSLQVVKSGRLHESYSLTDIKVWFVPLFAQTCCKQIKHLDRQGVQMQEKNAALDLKVADMEITVAERRNIYEAVGN